MSKKRLISILVFILFALLITGCQHKQNETIPSIPGIDMSSDKLNQDINLILWRTQNTFKIDDSVVINVHLQSDIQVDSGFDVKMYVLDKKNNKWIETADFVGAAPFLLPLKNETIILDKNNSNSTIIVHPVLQEKKF